MRAILVGAGGMGQTWARNLADHPSVELAAWVDVRPGAAAAAIESHRLGGVTPYDSVEKALAEAGADFLVDVTPPEVHHDVTLAALAAGLPVLGEKPMAANMSQARAMVAASERADKLYMVSQSRRYNAQLQAFRRYVQSDLGELGMLNADFYIGAHFGGFRDTMESPLILDMAIHTFDQARFVAGRDAVSVYAEEFNPRWSWYSGDASASALFEMEDGVRFNYRGSWCAEGCHTSWDADWRAVGSRGTIKWEQNGAPTGERVAGDTGFFRALEPVSPTVDPIEEGIAGSLAEFIAALNGGPTPNGECHDNIRSLAMVFAVKASAATGTRVRISDVG
ncbi:MAG: Gfo/Idh/MocA family oxidoreductase [Fimbriimonadaceae bacterium]|nr:Gfo/Idh/MocA family oxidoreductase [Fimbriimonadaceae bacterium]